jgi:hypothetical protein
MNKCGLTKQPLLFGLERARSAHPRSQKRDLGHPLIGGREKVIRWPIRVATAKSQAGSVYLNGRLTARQSTPFPQTGGTRMTE